MAPLAQFTAFRRSTAKVKRIAKQLAATPLVPEPPASTPATWADQVAAHQVVMPVAARAYIPRDAFVIGEYPSLADEIADFLVGGGTPRALVGDVLPVISEAEQEAEADEIPIGALPQDSLPTPPATPCPDEHPPATPTPRVSLLGEDRKNDSLPSDLPEHPRSAPQYRVYHKPNAFASRTNLAPAPLGAFIVGDCSADSLQNLPPDVSALSLGRRHASVVPHVLPSPPSSPLVPPVSSISDLCDPTSLSDNAVHIPSSAEVLSSQPAVRDSNVDPPACCALQTQMETRVCATAALEEDGRTAASNSSDVKAARPKLAQQLAKTWQGVRPAVKKRLAELEIVVRDRKTVMFGEMK